MGIVRNSSIQTLRGMSRSSQVAQWAPYQTNYIDNFEQVTISHPFWVRGSRSGDVGGAWYLHRTTHEINPLERNDVHCVGPVAGTAIVGWTSGNALHLLPTDSELKGLGTTAISRVTPNNPSVSVSQTLGEAREGFPKMFGSGLLKEKTRLLKGGSKEYLNVQFGWLPIISDLKKYAHTVKHRNEIIRSFKKGSDRKIRRRYPFPPNVSTDSRAGTVITSPSHGASGMLGTMTEFRESRSWFSGAFRYHIPLGSDILSKLDRYDSYANKLLGVSLTPDTVWNLAPWSWAADWFSNTGDLMTNVSNLGNDGMVMQYGYMMSSAKNERTVTFGNTSGGRGYYRKVIETKRRIPASPYGFDMTWDGLTNRQLAILAAIGLTRGKR